jgi:hypothetical protein
MFHGEAAMPEIRYACISDTHFGADNSVLTNLAPGTGGVDPSKPSDVLVCLVDCLRDLIARNPADARPTLILNGDIFEFALSTDNLAAMAFQRFIELAMPPDPAARLFNPTILFIPGNHDHHLWESAREIQYSRYLEKVPTQSFIEAPWHTTEMFGGADIPSVFANAVIKRCPWLSGDVAVITRYPNMALRKDRKLLIFSHGHFTEALYLLMSSLADCIFPRAPGRGDVDVWEEENFAWIDFFWSTLGRSGPVGPEVEVIYETMQDPGKFSKFVDDAVRNLAKLYGGEVTRHLGWLIAFLVRSIVAGRLERAKPEKLLGDDGAGLRRYLQGPVKGQLEEELAGCPQPEDITFVFGHTHKPFEELMTIVDFPTPYVRVYNSGGWVVDRPKPQLLYGGAVILLDDNFDAVSLRMYNEAETAAGYQVKVAAAGPPPAFPSPFYTWIKAAVKPNASPWTAFSLAAAATVAAHTKKIADALAHGA